MSGVLDRLRRGDAIDRATPELRGARLIEEDLAKLDLSGLDLSRADLSRADLRGANLAGALLADTNLFGAKIEGCELLGADLRGADLNGVAGARAGFGGADLGGARMCEADLTGAIFTRANLEGASFRCADLRAARICDASLVGADLAHADLRGADLAGSAVESATFNESDLRGARFDRLRGFESASWIGVDLRDADLRGAQRLRRDILDENYLYEFRSQSRTAGWLYQLWWLTSDCGRSIGRWALWVGLMIVLFAGLYTLVDVDYGDHATFLSPIYFSVVTITTLGYGDVLPASVAAQAVAILQVATGYLALGGLISIFANKMARRAE